MSYWKQEIGVESEESEEIKETRLEFKYFLWNLCLIKVET